MRPLKLSMKLQLMVLGLLRSPTCCTQPTCCVVKKAPSTVFCMRSGTMARGCWMCQACWSHYLYPSVSMAPVLLATLNFLFTCQWCCTSLSTAAYTLSCCRPLKVNSLPKASLAASPHKTKLDLVWNSVEQNT